MVMTEQYNGSKYMEQTCGDTINALIKRGQVGLKRTFKPSKDMWKIQQEIEDGQKQINHFSFWLGAWSMFFTMLPLPALLLVCLSS